MTLKHDAGNLVINSFLDAQPVQIIHGLSYMINFLRLHTILQAMFWMCCSFAKAISMSLEGVHYNSLI